MSKEQIINMPLKPEVKKLLEKQAEANGRAMGREAAHIVERDVLKGTKKK